MTRHSELVVVGLDDSPAGRAALRFALHDAVRRGARVDAVAAFRLPEYGWGVNGMAVSAAVVDRSVAEIHDAVREQAQKIVDEVLADIGDSVVVPPPVTVLAVGGSAGEALVHAARTADLLVVGSRGRGAFTSAMLGSVGLHCVLHARCPVTVVHPAEDREPAPAAG
jgi:nucleotide-binding universal stress UspA family protein